MRRCCGSPSTRAACVKVHESRTMIVIVYYFRRPVNRRLAPYFWRCGRRVVVEDVTELTATAPARPSREARPGSAERARAPSQSRVARAAREAPRAVRLLSGCRPSSWLLPMRPQRLRAHPPGGSDRVDEDVVGGRQAAAFGLLPAFMNVDRVPSRVPVRSRSSAMSRPMVSIRCSSPRSGHRLGPRKCRRSSSPRHRRGVRPPGTRSWP